MAVSDGGGVLEAEREDGDGALRVLEAWCEVRIGRTQAPSDVAEERRRPCRAQWGHDLYGQAVGEARSQASIHPSAWKGGSPKFAGTEFYEVRCAGVLGNVNVVLPFLTEALLALDGPVVV